MTGTMYFQSILVAGSYRFLAAHVVLGSGLLTVISVPVGSPGHAEHQSHLPSSCSSATANPELPGAAEAPVWDASALLMYCNRACPEGLWHADFLWS